MPFSALLVVLMLPFSLLGSFWPRISFPQVKSVYLKESLTYPLIPSVQKRTTPKLTPTPEAAVSPKPLLVPTPTPVSSPGPTSAPANYGDQTSYFLEQINDYRRSQGLSSVRPEPNTCSFAVSRTQEIISAFNHDGFTGRINNKTLPYPNYHFVTENIARNSNYQEVVKEWINSPGHAANMRADTPFVCVKSSGNFYVYEGWKP